MEFEGEFETHITLRVEGPSEVDALGPGLPIGTSSSTISSSTGV